MKYEYFISYYAIKNGTNSIGNCSIKREEKITKFDEIEGICEIIKNDSLLDNVVIINFIELGG